MVLAPNRPLEPLASSSPSGDSARLQGQVVCSCRPCSVRRHTHSLVLHVCVREAGGKAECVLLLRLSHAERATSFSNHAAVALQRALALQQAPTSAQATFKCAALPCHTPLPAACCPLQRCTACCRRAPPPARARRRRAL